MARRPHLQTLSPSPKVLKGHFHPLVERGPHLRYPRCLTARAGRRYLIFLMKIFDFYFITILKYLILTLSKIISLHVDLSKII